MANEIISALILAVIQGITEWLPVSSSGHLVLFSHILKFQGSLFFDVALHFGTLMAVFVYFGRDIVDIIRDLFKGNFQSENGKLGGLLIIASIPAAIIGFLFKNFFEGIYENLGIVAIGFGITGLFLMIASIDFGQRIKKYPSYLQSFLIGIAQAIAIIPGISRSGATIASGVLLELDIKSAMRFSFLMSIPIIFGANIAIVGNNRIPGELIWATLVAFIVGLMTLYFLFRYVLTSRKALRWFGIYALLLGIGIGAWLALS